jgi:hypothetical protein
MYRGLLMIWRPDLFTVMRVFLLVLAVVFLLSGTAMLVLTLPLRFPWFVHTDLAARYAVFFLAVAAVCALAIKGIDKRR